MNSRLHQIQNSPELAQTAGWSAATQVKNSGVLVVTLERYIREDMSKSPKVWIAEQRQHRAVELLRDGRWVKETATSLGYKHASTFSREFMKHSDHYPTRLGPPKRPARGEMSHKAMKCRVWLCVSALSVRVFEFY